MRSFKEFINQNISIVNESDTWFSDDFYRLDPYNLVYRERFEKISKEKDVLKYFEKLVKDSFKKGGSAKQILNRINKEIAPFMYSNAKFIDYHYGKTWDSYVLTLQDNLGNIKYLKINM